MERQETCLLTESPEAVTSVEGGHRDWASLPFPVIECLVRLLKDTRRWRLEGRSLRLLNRHWSAAIGMHVDEIRPDATRTIVDEDIASLLKFRRVTSVDISPFLIQPSRYTKPKTRRQKKLYLKNWYDTKLERIVDRLRQLPQLAQIEVGLKVVTILYNHCSRVGEQFSRLGRITSVYFYGRENLKLYRKTHLSISWTELRHDEHQSDYSSTLTTLVRSLRHLETLEVEGSVLDSCVQFDYLDQVKHVVLEGVDSRILTQLSNPSAAVSSVAVFPPHRCTRDIPVQQTRLDGLSLAGVKQDDLNQLSRTSAAECLKVLDMEGYFEVEELVFPSGTTITTFRQLECLNFVSCHILGASLRGTLPNLKALRIENCTLTDSYVTFVTQFHKLELLKWYDVICPRLRLLHLPWEKLKLPNLRSLCVVPLCGDSEVLSISRQTSLEVLKIGSWFDSLFPVNLTNEGLCVLEELHNLRILYIVAYETKTRRMWSSLLSVKFLTKLEQLWMQFDRESVEDEDSFERIKCISPHLILKSGWHSILRLDSAIFI